MSGFQDCHVDADTVAAAQAGQRDARQRIYAEYSNAVYTLAWRMVQQREVAEEVLQDTFVQVLGKLDSYRGEAPLGAWIRRIAVNQALSQLRSAWFRRSQSLDSIDEPASPDQPHTDDHLQQAFQQLQPVTRAVLWLHDVEGYTHKEIADLMSRSVSFSKSQLSRGHRRLRELLEPFAEAASCMQASTNY